MAESADRRNPTERYGAIEKAYCADQWAEVIDQGQDLLQEIPRSSAPIPEGLKERVQLLMAHAHLYGFNDRAAAEDLYSDVLHSKAELALRQIAEQGLQQCSLGLQPTAAVIQAGATEARSPRPVAETAAAASAQTTAAAQEQASAQEQAAAVDSHRAGVPDSEPARAPASARSAAAAPAAAAPAATSSLAMPWLVAGAAVSTAAAAAASTAPTPWTTVATPPAIPESSPPPQPEETASEINAPGSAASAPGSVVSVPGDEQATLIPEVVEEPELFEIHQADPSLAEELELTELQPPATMGLPDEDRTASATALSAAAALASAEILRDQAKAGPAAQAESLPCLAGQEPLDRNQKLAPEPRQRNQAPAAPAYPQRLEPPTARTEPAPDLEEEMDGLCALFGHPPTPVEEEDPELLLGLLRVLVSAGSASDGG